MSLKAASTPPQTRVPRTTQKLDQWINEILMLAQVSLRISNFSALTWNISVSQRQTFTSDLILKLLLSYHGELCRTITGASSCRVDWRVSGNRHAGNLFASIFYATRSLVLVRPSVDISKCSGSQSCIPRDHAPSFQWCRASGAHLYQQVATYLVSKPLWLTSSGQYSN